MNKKNLAVVTLTLCILTALIFQTVPTQSSFTTTGHYDPWSDINDDGVINILDVVQVVSRYATTGPPVDKTALLYNVNATFTSLINRIATLNASLTTLHANFDSFNTSLVNIQISLAILENNVGTLETEVTDLATTTTQITSRIDALNATLAQLENTVAELATSGFTSTPAYDSGWIDITNMAGKNITLTHNLNDTALSIEIQGKTTLADGTHQKHLGLTDYTPAWSKTYGGTNIDFGRSVIKTTDGGYAIGGYTYSSGAGGADFYLVKTDSIGNVQWTKTYGGTTADMAYSVIQTRDGGYAITGQTNSYGAGGYDFYLVKTDQNGNTQWIKTYGGTGNDAAYSVIQTSDNGYAVAGQTSSFGAGMNDVYFVKTDSSGNMQWSKTYGGTGNDYGYSLITTRDSGYAIAGDTNSSGAGGHDFYLIKTDSSGNMQWTKTYGGANTDIGYALIPTSDGGYAIAGQTNSFGAGNFDMYLVKTNSTGNLQWSKTYGGAYADVGYSVIQTKEGGYAVGGYTYSFGAGDADGYLVKTDSLGNTQWTKTYGGSSTDYGYSVIQTSEGSYALAGYTYSFGTGNYDVWLVKTEAELGLAQTDSTADTITLYRGTTDPYWNYVRVLIWKIKQNP